MCIRDRPEDVESFDTFVELRSRTQKDSKYVLDTSGAVITEKLARLLDIKDCLLYTSRCV